MEVTYCTLQVNLVNSSSQTDGGFVYRVLPTKSPSSQVPIQCAARTDDTMQSCTGCMYMWHLGFDPYFSLFAGSWARQIGKSADSDLWSLS